MGLVNLREDEKDVIPSTTEFYTINSIIYKFYSICKLHQVCMNGSQQT